ncbi:MAG: hypothetical protein CM1200mP16_08190 [Nitrospina sp.]|nr:MAG: hypothetical protein CM1200mP16_08190 [Nitrospina sp.]
MIDNLFKEKNIESLKTLSLKKYLENSFNWGTGFVGSYILDELIKNNMTPRLLVRNGSQSKLLQHEKCELVFGDIENNNAVIKTLFRVVVPSSITLGLFVNSQQMGSHTKNFIFREPNGA